MRDVLYIVLLLAMACMVSVENLLTHAYAKDVQRLQNLISLHSKRRLAETNGEWSKADLSLYFEAKNGSTQTFNQEQK